jgi:superfamily II RNA helicase
MLPNNTFPEFCFYHDLYLKQKNEKFKFLELLDRGRLEEIKHAKSTAEWMKIIDKSGLKVVEHRRHLSKTVIQMWDIGLRPLFPVLHKMVAHIDPDQLKEIKKEFIVILKMFLEPISKLDGDLVQGAEPAFHCFTLEK